MDPTPARILVVEDHADAREALVDILDGCGFAALGAFDGLDALERLAKLDAKPAAILLDLMMPRMDGLTFRRAQLSDPGIAPIPTIALTAVSRARESASGLGFAAIFEKPYDVGRLLEAVRAVVATGSAPACA